MNKQKKYFRKNLGIILFLFLFIALVTFGYIYLRDGDKEETVEVKGKNSVIDTRINLGITNYDSMNPHLTQNKDILQIDNLIFEGLFRITKDYNIEPCLIEEWSKISDTRYIFKLKDNVKWSDGKTLTAKDIKFTIENIKSKDKSIYRDNMLNIMDVDLVDDQIFSIEFKKDISFIEYQLLFPIVQKECNKEIEEGKRIPVGTGMFKISEITDDEIILITNENYWNFTYAMPKIKEIIVKIYENKGKIYTEFIKGNIDLIETKNADFTEYIGDIGYNKMEYKNRRLEYISFNCDSKRLCDKEMRKALNYLVNKKEILEQLDNKVYISEFLLDYGRYESNNDYNVPEYDPNKARDILNNLGWKFIDDFWVKDENVLQFELAVEKDDKEAFGVANIIKTQLENFGIKIDLKELKYFEYKKVLQEHDYEILLVGMYNGFSPDLIGFFGDNNLANYESCDIKKKILELNERNTSEIQNLYKKIINIYYDEVPYISLYRGKSYIIYSKKLIGEISPNDYNIFYNFDKWYKK